MTAKAHTLCGFVDPSGVCLGFLVPVFRGRGSNAPLVQRIAPNGTIRLFEPYEAPGAATLDAPELAIAPGEAALHAFAFGKGDIVIVHGTNGRDDLLTRSRDPALEPRPMLAMELAEFLGERKLRIDAALRAHAELRRVSKNVANQWMDLSVLTPEVRSALQRTLGRYPDPFAMIVARVAGEVIEILGLQERPDEGHRKALRTAATTAIADLAELYPRPPGGWRVHIRESSAHEQRSDARAAVLLASDRARELARDGAWPPFPELDVYLDDGSAFERVVRKAKIPLFVVYAAAEADDVSRYMGEHGRGMHGIVLGTARGRMAVDRDLTSPSWPSTHIPTAGLGGGGRGELASLRLAIAAELERTAQGIDLHSPTSVLLRARGSGPDPEADAWAALYDRAWGMGLAPCNAMLIPGPARENRSGGAYSANYSPSYRSEFEPGWMARALYHDPLLLGGTTIEPLMAHTRTTAALLVATGQRETSDLRLHRNSVTKLLERLGWSIDDENFRDPDALLIVKGRQARFEVLVRSETAAPTEWKHRPLLDLDLLTINRVIVSGPAATGAVLSHLLASHELVVGMRDLANAEAAHTTALSIVAAQLRRMVTGLHTPARTHLVALIAMQALRGGNPGEGARELLDLIEHPGFGRDIHLTVGSAKVIDEGLMARIRILSVERERPGSRNELGAFVMTILPTTVSVSAFEWRSNVDEDTDRM